LKSRDHVVGINLFLFYSPPFFHLQNGFQHELGRLQPPQQNLDFPTEVSPLPMFLKDLLFQGLLDLGARLVVVPLGTQMKVFRIKFALLLQERGQENLMSVFAYPAKPLVREIRIARDHVPRSAKVRRDLGIGLQEKGEPLLPLQLDDSMDVFVNALFRGNMQERDPNETVDLVKQTMQDPRTQFGGTVENLFHIVQEHAPGDVGPLFI
jgi:hypothetical protein